MTHASAQLVRHLRKLTTRPSDAQPDRELVRRFISDRDESAFAALVERHAAMVMGLCRSILHNSHDAEDTFQAAFLVLARKAASIRNGESVGSFLYAVAYRLAQKARVRSGKRREQELSALPLLGPTPMDDLSWRELRGILHEEVSRLPEKYRAAIVLCYWQDQTHEQAAQQLGCAKGTVKDRLERARELLRTRLARRGLALSAAWFATSLSGGMSSAAVSAEFVRTTVRGAMLFSMGELPAGVVSAHAVTCAKGMLLGKLKFGALLMLLAGVLGGGAGLAALREAETPTPEAPAEQPKAAAPKQEQEHTDLLPPGAVARLGTLRFRHGERIQDIALGGDGKSIVSAAGKIVHVWELATGKERCRLDGFEVPVACIACSPDGKVLAAGCEDGTIRLWDPVAVREIRRFLAHKGRDPKSVGPSGVSRLHFSPDGRQLVSAGSDNALCLWDTATGERRHEFCRFRSLWGLSLSPDGKTLAAVVEDENWTIRLWEVATGREGKRLTELGGRPTTAAFAPDGKTLAVGVGESDWKKPCDIKLWDVASAKEIRGLRGHQGWVGCLVFASDGQTLVSASSADLTARLWNVKTGAEVCRIGPDRQSPLFKLLYGPDGKTLISYGQENSLRFWDAATGKEERASKDAQSWIGAVSFSPDGRLLASGSADGLIQLWDAATRKEVRRFTHSGWLIGLPFSPDGRLLASAGMFDPIVRIWDAATGKETRQIKTPGIFMTCLSWSGDGKTLATWSRQDRLVHLWDAATGKEKHHLGPIAEWVNSVVFAPDGRTLAVAVAEHAALAGNSGQGKGNILLWATDTGRLLRRLEEPAGINCLAFSPDGRTLAAGGMDQAIHLWETVSSRKRGSLKHGENVTSLAWSPDGKLLASVNNKTSTKLSSDGTTGTVDTSKPRQPRARVWDVGAAEEMKSLQGHQGAITSLTFSPDGKLLASASNDTTVLLWDATRLKTRPLAAAQPRPEELERLWVDLDSGDAVKAYRAIRTLAAAPQSSVDFLKRHLHPVVPADSKQVALLLADLDGDDFAAREKATRELEKLGETAAANLHKALANKPSLEVKRRIEQLLEKQNGKEHMRMVRALEALERIGTPEARKLCALLARGVAEARLTREAQATLRRLSRGTNAAP